MEKKNLFSDIPLTIKKEIFEVISISRDVKIERIISKGQTTPAGEWYDQESNEFVVLLKGRASLIFEDNNEIYELKPGDCINIPAHTRHRVEWTDEKTISVWLAVYYR